MASLAKQDDDKRRPDVTDNVRSRLLDCAFQLCFAWFLIGLTWHMAGPVPETTPEYVFQVVMLWLGYAFSIGLWIARSRRLPMACIPVLLVVGLLAAVDSVREFDASARVLVPAQVKNGRVIHQGLDLSYMLFPGCQVDLQPRIKRSPNPLARGKPMAPPRLQLEEIARLSQIVLAPESQHGDDDSMIIQLDIVHDRPRGLSAFVRRVRDFEKGLISRPNMHVIRPTHRSRIAGFDAVEFEYLNNQQKRIYRQVQLRIGHFILNFSLHFVHEADRPHVDEFLNSIRLESPAWYGGSPAVHGLGIMR